MGQDPIHLEAQIAEILKESQEAKSDIDKIRASLTDAEKRITKATKQLSASEAKVSEPEQTCSALT